MAESLQDRRWRYRRTWEVIDSTGLDLHVEKARAFELFGLKRLGEARYFAPTSYPGVTAGRRDRGEIDTGRYRRLGAG